MLKKLCSYPGCHTLNSTLILLILLKFSNKNVLLQSLNSTLILLILMQLIQQSISLKPLNSTLILLISLLNEHLQDGLAFFKFHFDSINMHKDQFCDEKIRTLNSTLILLIYMKNIMMFADSYPLNSTLILLIL